MRCFAKWMLVVGLAAVMAGPAMAQDKGKGRGKGGGGQGRGGFGGGFGGQRFLLAMPTVQDEIKLTEDQKTKVTDHVTKQGEAMRELFAGGGFDAEKMQELTRTNTAANEKLVKDLLKPDQVKRYNGIKFQDMGVNAFKETEVQTALKLTADQKEKLNALAEDYTKDRGELLPMGFGRGGGKGKGGGGGGRGGLDPELGTKLTALKKDFMTKATKVLTASQQKDWSDLVGKDFEVPAFGGGGRGGRGFGKDK